MGAQAKFAIETDYMRAFARSGYSVTVTVAISLEMRRLGFSLPDVHYLARHGRVVASDMLDHRGLWTMAGRNVDGVGMRVTYAVESEECDVEVIRVLRIERGGGQ